MPRICAGIVLFNPEIDRLRKNISNICNQVMHVFIVDNASQNVNEVIGLLEEFSNVSLVKNNDNMGIATALNQLCQKADSECFEWILTLDQDSVCDVNLIKNMVPYTDNESLGIICPAIEYEIQTKQDKNVPITEYVYACMTSASLTRLKAWRNVGGFREDYFIDFVDNEFCMKLAINKYKILRVNKCHLSHRLGEIREFKTICGKNIKVTTHSPLRFYYMARNNAVFIKEYKKYLNVPKEYIKLIYILVGGVIRAHNKKDTFQHIKKGLNDAKVLQMGKIVYNR